jgi:hypothetical protein
MDVAPASGALDLATRALALVPWAGAAAIFTAQCSLPTLGCGTSVHCANPAETTESSHCGKEATSRHRCRHPSNGRATDAAKAPLSPSLHPHALRWNALSTKRGVAAWGNFCLDDTDGGGGCIQYLYDCITRFRTSSITSCGQVVTKSLLMRPKLTKLFSVCGPWKNCKTSIRIIFNYSSTYLPS